MNTREYIQKLNIEKQQLIDENKLLKDKVNELEDINSKLVDELNSYKDHNIENVVDKVEDTLSVITENVIASAIEPEDEQKRGTSIDEIESEKKNPSDDENASKIGGEEVADETTEEEQKPKRSRRKKETENEDSVINLM